MDDKWAKDLGRAADEMRDLLISADLEYMADEIAHIVIRALIVDGVTSSDE